VKKCLQKTSEELTFTAGASLDSNVSLDYICCEYDCHPISVKHAYITSILLEALPSERVSSLNVRQCSTLVSAIAELLENDIVVVHLELGVEFNAPPDTFLIISEPVFTANH